MPVATLATRPTFNPPVNFRLGDLLVDLVDIWIPTTIAPSAALPGEMADKGYQSLALGYQNVICRYEPTPEFDKPMTPGLSKEVNIFTLDKWHFLAQQAINDGWLVVCRTPGHQYYGRAWIVQGNSTMNDTVPGARDTDSQWVYAKLSPTQEIPVAISSVANGVAVVQKAVSSIFVPNSANVNGIGAVVQSIGVSVGLNFGSFTDTLYQGANQSSLQSNSTQSWNKNDLVLCAVRTNATVGSGPLGPVAATSITDTGGGTLSSWQLAAGTARAQVTAWQHTPADQPPNGLQQYMDMEIWFAVANANGSGKITANLAQGVEFISVFTQNVSGAIAIEQAVPAVSGVPTPAEVAYPSVTSVNPWSQAFTMFWMGQLSGNPTAPAGYTVEETQFNAPGSYVSYQVQIGPNQSAGTVVSPGTAGVSVVENKFCMAITLLIELVH
jgi:hypothetical protein